MHVISCILVFASVLYRHAYRDALPSSYPLQVLSEEEVELSWSTGDETGNKGFIVQRRPGGSDSFAELASCAEIAPR